MGGVASAQTTTLIRGVVTDPTGAAAPNATITLENVGTNAVRTTTSDASGAYQILQVQPGVYRLRAELSGFNSIVNENLQLLVNTPATVNLKFEQLGQVATTVAVGAEAVPLLNTVDATMGNAFQEQQVKQLPIESRNVVDLLSLQPGVAYTGNRSDINLSTDTRSGAVNGARSDQTSVTMDGVNVTDHANGYAFTSVVRTTPDSLQEFRVTTINPTAAEGNSGGAQVALVTKGGTNSFHGSLYEYLRNTATSANDYFIKLAQIQGGGENQAPKLNRNVYGGSIGGPIAKNKLFFFVNYEGRKDRQENSVVVTVPTASARAGSVKYLNAAGGITTIDAGTLKAWDPLGIGPNAAVQSFFKGLPLPNDTSVGDGLNSSGYRFAAPSSKDLQVAIGRLDFKPDAAGKHNIFFRLSGQNDFGDNAPAVPGGRPLTTTADRSKALALGYTTILKPSLINEFRWGFTRASVGNFGTSSDAVITLAGFSGAQGISRSNATTLPTHNIVDQMNWVKGRHTITFGGGFLAINQGTYNTNNSFSGESQGTTAVEGGGIAFTGNAFDPAAHGFPDVSRNFSTSYDTIALAMTGLITTGSARYNYDRDGTVLPQGAPILRHYSMNEYDGFIQDSFRWKPNLTITLGLRYQYETPPHEVNGLQVSPSFQLNGATSYSLRDWWGVRVADTYAGIPANQMPVLSYVLGGSANGGPDFYKPDRNNFAPRASIAYSPSGSSGFLKRLFGDHRTTIRAGAGIVYDHFGTELINTYDANGSYGMSTGLSSGLSGQGFACGARITSLTTLATNGCATNSLPSGLLLSPAPAGGFPQAPDPTGYKSTWAIDDGIRTPYAYTLNFSIARQIKSNMSFEVAYVGRLSHKLLDNTDFAGQGNIRDPQSGVSLFQALSRLSQLSRANVPVSSITDQMVGPTAAFWNHLYQPLAVTNRSTNSAADCATPGTCTPVQGAYAVSKRYLYDDTFFTYWLDTPGQICATRDCSPLGSFAIWPAQFYGLRAWESQENANYHALQLSFRRRFGTGFQFDVNYVWSKSMDFGSDAQRVGNGGLKGQVVNAFDRSQLYSVSDFDMTHQLNANWLWELPFGKNRMLLSSAPKWLDAIVGGWQLSGIYRVTSGLPFGIDNGSKFPTGNSNGYAVRIGDAQTGTVKLGNGKVMMFSDATAAYAAFDRAYAGESGDRNVLRGDGFLSLDASLSKRWIMPYKESHSVQLRWEVFNVGNFTRFNAVSNRPSLTNVTNFGVYTNLLTNPRVMQFGLRYEF